MNVLINRTAQKEYSRLPLHVRKIIKRKLMQLADSQLAFPPIKKLQSPLLGYRLRVGVYRVLFVVQDTTIYVEKIAHRREVYR